MPTPRTRSVFGIDDQLGHAVGAIERQRAARGGPREPRDGDLALLLLGLVLGQPAPRQLGIGEDDGRNRQRLERHALAGDRLDGDAPFVRRLVREHRLADDVADRVDGRLGRAARRVDLDEAALIRP